MEANADWVASLRRERGDSEKSWAAAFVLSALFGWVGADRFYVGRRGLAIWKLLTMGGILRLVGN